MTELRLVAVDDQGSALVLRRADEEGEHAREQGGDAQGELRLPIDDRLRAALRADRARAGQLQIQLESQLRPRDIQARVRAGESVESVAQAAGISVDRVMRFAAPVLAEREHIADRAQRLPVRRPDGPGPELYDAVEAHLAATGAEGEHVDWDSWRREDGRWAVTATWRTGGKPRSARWVFDPAGRSVTPDDDTARAVSGEPRPTPAAAAPASAPTSAPEDEAAPARLAVVRDDPAAPATDADSTDGDRAAGAAAEPDRTATQPLPRVTESERPARRRGRAGSRRGRPRPEEDDRLRLSDLASTIEVDPPEAERVQPARSAPPAQPARPPVAREAPAASAGRRAARPSVPSWDEIMFGRRRHGGE